MYCGDDWRIKIFIIIIIIIIIVMANYRNDQPVGNENHDYIFNICKMFLVQ